MRVVARLYSVVVDAEYCEIAENYLIVAAVIDGAMIATAGSGLKIATVIYKKLITPHRKYRFYFLESKTGDAPWRNAGEYAI